MFIGLLSGLVNISNHTKCVSLSNKKCQECYYYPFAVKLHNCIESCNALNDSSNEVYAPNKTKDLSLNVSGMNTQKNESLFLTKIYHGNINVNLIVEGAFVIQVKIGIMINVDASAKNIIYLKKMIFGILLHVAAKIVNIYNTVYISIIENSVITCDEVIEAEGKTIAKKFIEKNISCKTQKFLYFTCFLLISIALLIAVSIYCYMIKYQAKQKHLSPFSRQKW